MDSADFDVTDARVVESLLAAKFRLSLRAIEFAKSIAWRDLPLNEKQRYLAWAEEAVRQELKS